MNSSSSDLNSSSGWWSTFFSGPAVSCWRQCLSEEQTRSEVDHVVRALGLPAGARVLDVPCGHGRIALELAARGFHVTGVDLSAEALDLARVAAVERGLALSLEQRDMRDLPWREAFDAVVCVGNSFAYLDDRGNRDFLEAVHTSLRSGGKLLLHAPCVHELLLPIQARAWYPVGDLIMLVDRRYDPIASALELEYTFVQDGKIDRRPARYRVHSVRELRQMLAEVGLPVTDLQGSTRGEPFALGAQTLYLVAARS
jgi:SAM-dependent methyltransferase